MNSSTQRFTLLVGALVSAPLITACGSLPVANVGQTAGKQYTITVKNTLPKERFAAILLVGDADDGKIWVGKYVSGEAHTQFTTGNPGPLAAQLGGDQAQPGKLPVGGEITFTFRTTAKKARLTAMVHPDITPDNYVTALLDLDKEGVTTLNRYDIGDDEKRKTVELVGPAGTVTLRAN